MQRISYPDQGAASPRLSKNSLLPRHSMLPLDERAQAPRPSPPAQPSALSLVSRTSPPSPTVSDSPHLFPNLFFKFQIGALVSFPLSCHILFQHRDQLVEVRTLRVHLPLPLCSFFNLRLQLLNWGGSNIPTQSPLEALRWSSSSRKRWIASASPLPLFRGIRWCVTYKLLRLRLSRLQPRE
jgi:hypothetical protein